jgi:hypothetical protein
LDHVPPPAEADIRIIVPLKREIRRGAFYPEEQVGVVANGRPRSETRRWRSVG